MIMAMETEYAKEYMRKWRGENREKYRAYQRDYQKRLREENKRILALAIKEGLI